MSSHRRLIVSYASLMLQEACHAVVTLRGWNLRAKLLEISDSSRSITIAFFKHFRIDGLAGRINTQLSSKIQSKKMRRKMTPFLLNLTSRAKQWLHHTKRATSLKAGLRPPSILLNRRKRQSHDLLVLSTLHSRATSLKTSREISQNKSTTN